MLFKFLTSALLKQKRKCKNKIKNSKRMPKPKIYCDLPLEAIDF